MAREIVTRRDQGLERGRPGAGAPPAADTPDEYQDRLVKYIPAEIVAAFLAVQNMVKAVDQSQVGIWFWVAFLALLILTPVYLRKVQKVGKVTQLVVSTVAFLIWVYALGGPFVGTPLYSPVAAAILLIVYTVGVATIEPSG